MKLRKNEREALLEVMDLAEQPDAFGTRDEFLDLLVKRLDDVRGEREFFYGIVNTAGINAILGPFSTRHQATQAVEKTPAEKAWIVPGRSAEGWAVWIGEVDSPAATKGDFKAVQEDVILYRRGWNGQASTRKQYEDKAS